MIKLKIFEKYLLQILLRNLIASSLVFTALFIISDFFDRIDNILERGANFFTIIWYFILKAPGLYVETLPLALTVGTVFTYGLLCKNSEITAFRSAGLKLKQLARPIFMLGAGFSLFSLILSETLVPLATRRAREIYNIDIQQRDQRGEYSKQNIWWRNKNQIISAENFDSRDLTLKNIREYRVTPDFKVKEFKEAKEAQFISTELGWSMNNVIQYSLKKGEVSNDLPFRYSAFPIKDLPEDFFDVKTEPTALSFRAFRKFIKKQTAQGLPANQYLTDLYAKISYPFVILISAVLAFTFSLKTARSGSLSAGFLAALGSSFAWYAVHSFSLALGRAEILPPLLAAWTANLLLALIATVLFLGAESPD